MELRLEEVVDAVVPGARDGFVVCSGHFSLELPLDALGILNLLQLLVGALVVGVPPLHVLLGLAEQREEIPGFLWFLWLLYPLGRC